MTTLYIPRIGIFRHINRHGGATTFTVREASWKPALAGPFQLHSDAEAALAALLANWSWND